MLLFSRGAHGGVNVKLSDFFCFPVRSKDELSAILKEKFDQVPEMKDFGDALDVDQWRIIDAELFVAGELSFAAFCQFHDCPVVAAAAPFLLSLPLLFFFAAIVFVIR